jgi:hypothetical protein
MLHVDVYVNDKAKNIGFHFTNGTTPWIFLYSFLYCDILRPTVTDISMVLCSSESETQRGVVTQNRQRMLFQRGAPVWYWHVEDLTVCRSVCLSVCLLNFLPFCHCIRNAMCFSVLSSWTFDIILRHTMYSLCSVLFVTVPLYCDTRHIIYKTLWFFSLLTLFCG